MSVAPEFAGVERSDDDQEYPSYQDAIDDIDARIRMATVIIAARDKALDGRGVSELEIYEIKIWRKYPAGKWRMSIRGEIAFEGKTIVTGDKPKELQD